MTRARKAFGKFTDKLSSTAFVRHISFLWHWKNFFLLLKYPFYRVYNRWTGKFMGYAYTELDSVPQGWRKAFGKQMSKDIKAAGKASRKASNKRLSWKQMITWEQIKEKYGGLRLYAAATDEIQKVLDKYELLSEGYCIECGQPARYKTPGWIEYYCKECFIDEVIKRGRIDEKSINKDLQRCRLKKKDIPRWTHYDEHGKGRRVDFKKELGIDFEELWGLKEGLE